MPGVAEATRAQPALCSTHAAKCTDLPWEPPELAKGGDHTEQSVIQLIGADQGCLNTGYFLG